MIAFKVSINGKHVCTAGVRHFGAVSAIVAWVRRKPSESRNGKTLEELIAEIGGLDSDANEHLKWLERSIHVGDRIAIEVVDAKRVDKPKARYREDPRDIEREKRRYFERLKKELEASAAPKKASTRRFSLG